MVMSRDQNAGRSHNIKTDNSSFERVEQFKYLGTTLTYQNSIQKEIRSRLKSGNTCYHLVQNPLSSSLLSKNVKIKIYKTIILPVVLYGHETWSLTLREEHTQRVCCIVDGYYCCVIDRHCFFFFSARLWCVLQVSHKLISTH